MSLSSGSIFGTFEIASPLGAGGMGEVYRARDLRLNRGVALKVMPELLARDPDRLARFKREAQLLAALSHRNIAAIHGIEEANGVYALVLELVEGQTLAERIAQGPIPIEDALPIAVQIAEALEAAHEIGIIHRDLKPANIKISDQGVVKVLDFGLAKALDTGATSVDVSQSPTLSLAATQMGVILGTAAYMAPEQARGKDVDRRADVWAFGCVLYEMLTGRKTFAPSTGSGSSRAQSRDEGESLSDILAAVLRGDPDWAALPSSTPHAIRRLLRRCVEKDRRERLQAIGDARIEIKEAMAAGTDAAAVAAPVAPQPPAAGRVMPIVAVASTAILAGLAVWMLKPSAPATAPHVTRALLAVQPFDRRSPAPAGENRVPITRRDRTSIALSPDGRTLVLRALADRAEQLFVRPLDRLDWTPLAGTEGAESPFFSPDGAWIGYRSGGELRKIPIAGGVSSVITRVPGAGTAPRIYGASWGSGDVVVFATAEGVWQVGAAGGDPRQVSTPAKTEYRHSLPHVLPGGRAVLFTITKASFRWTDAQVVVRTLETGEQKVLIENAADPRYVSSGHIIFLRSGTLMAAPFDIARLEMTGGAVALIEGVMQALNTGNSGNDSGAGQVAVSSNGTLVYATGGLTPDQPRALAWVDRSGAATPLELPERQYSTPKISPDGQRIAVTIGPDAERRIWVHDVVRGGITAITPIADGAFWNVWSPNGQRIAFSAVGGYLDVRSSDGSGSAERLTVTPGFSAPTSWSSDGRLIVFVDRDPETAEDIWIKDVSEPTQPPRPYLRTTASDTFPALSPDGKWMAYASNQSGRLEVYVQPYPGPGPRVQVSTEGGNSAAWAGNGAEIFYTQPAGATNRDIAMMAVTAKATATGMAVDRPRKLFEGRFALTVPGRGYDVTADGRRFLMVQQKDLPPQPPVELVLVENWFEDLKRSTAR
jgi:eukaryotic-like serine/threonine-protein kinase